MKHLISRKHTHTILILIALVAIVTPLYLYRLSTQPYAVHGDEAETAMQALKIIAERPNLFGVGWYDLPLISFLPHTWGMLVFGPGILGDRMGSVLMGLLTLPVFFLLMRELATTRTAAIATLLLATSNMWIAMSRIGITYVEATWILVCCFYMMHRALRTARPIDYGLAGFFMGLGIYSYYAARIIPIIAIPYLIVRLWPHHTGWKKPLVRFALCITTAAIVILPQAIYFLHDPLAVSSRAKDVLIFSDSTREWREDVYGKTGPLMLAWQQFTHSINIFAGDGSGQYGYKGPLLDMVTLALFGIGFLVIIRRPASPRGSCSGGLRSRWLPVR